MNLNDTVRVRLTYEGRRVHRQRHDDFWAAIAKSAMPQPYVPPVEKDGWSEWQLWVLMEQFGPYTWIGAKPLFEGNEIVLDSRG